MIDRTTAVEPPSKAAHRAFGFWPVQPADFAIRTALVLTMAAIWGSWAAIAMQRLFG